VIHHGAPIQNQRRQKLLLPSSHEHGAHADHDSEYDVFRGGGNDDEDGPGVHVVRDDGAGERDGGEGPAAVGHREPQGPLHEAVQLRVLHGRQVELGALKNSRRQSVSCSHAHAVTHTGDALPTIIAAHKMLANTMLNATAMAARSAHTKTPWTASVGN
jgi:hypothetical protein